MSKLIKILFPFLVGTIAGCAASYEIDNKADRHPTRPTPHYKGVIGQKYPDIQDVFNLRRIQLEDYNLKKEYNAKEKD